MPRTTISRTALPATGLNLTDATFSTLTLGAGNGIEVPFREGDVLVLKNGTGGAAVFTVKVRQPQDFTRLGITVPDESFSVAASKTFIVPIAQVFKQTDGDIYVDCDVAGAVICLAVSG
jgi:hypothetical protein